MARKKQRKERGRTHTGCWYYETASGDLVYYCSYRKDGKNITAKLGAKSKGYSLSQAALYRADLLRGKEQTRPQKRAEDKEAGERHIEMLFELYKTEKERGVKDDSLFNLYVLPFYKGLDIAECTNKLPIEHSQWLLEQGGRYGKGLSPQTVKHAMAMFRRIYLHSAGRERLVPKITSFAMPRVNNVVTEYLDVDELSRYITVLETDKINRAVGDMMLLSLCTGMRQGEILKLRWTDVDTKAGVLKLRDTKGSKQKGYQVGSVTHTVPLNKDAQAILDRQPKKSMVVFPNGKGEQRRCVTKQAVRLRDKAGLGTEIRPFHSLRHIYATRCIEKGIPLKTVSELLGHSSVSVTERYVEVTDEVKAAAASRMNLLSEVAR